MKTTNATRSQVMKNAHVLRTNGLTMKAALKAAWYMERMAQANSLTVSSAWVKPGTTEVRFYLNGMATLHKMAGLKAFFAPKFGTTFFNNLHIVGGGMYTNRIEREMYRMVGY